MVSKKNNKNYIIIFFIAIILILSVILYKGYQKQILNEVLIQKQEMEIKDLKENMNKSIESLYLIKNKLDEAIKNASKLVKYNNELIKERDELIIQVDVKKAVKNIESKYGLVRLLDIDTSFIEDLKYATEDNFVGKKIYPNNSIAILRTNTALKLKNANEIFKKDGYVIKILDAYRPLYVQYIFWNFAPGSKYLANPKTGSKHNRGAAVDLTLVDINGNEIEMGTKFDNFTEKASYNYKGHSEIALKNMKYLRTVMEEVGFKGISTEWWHFDDVDWENYDILDIGFDELN